MPTMYFMYICQACILFTYIVSRHHWQMFMVYHWYDCAWDTLNKLYACIWCTFLYSYFCLFPLSFSFKLHRHQIQACKYIMHMHTDDTLSYRKQIFYKHIGCRYLMHILQVIILVTKQNFIGLQSRLFCTFSGTTCTC